MEDIEKVMIDNLKETLKSAQTYLLTGTIAALFLGFFIESYRGANPLRLAIIVGLPLLSLPISSFCMNYLNLSKRKQ